MGYTLAGFDVFGVDINPQPHYPFPFYQEDALTFPLDGFDAIHASPPCQGYTSMSNRWRGTGGAADKHPKLIHKMRDRLEDAGVPWVLENVTGARKEMRNPILLHGGMFDLGVYRPRLFESNVVILATKADPPKNPVGVLGKLDGRRLFTRVDGTEQRAARTLEEARKAMDIWWMDWKGLTESIPPAYTRFIGWQLLRYVSQQAEADVTKGGRK